MANRRPEPPRPRSCSRWWVKRCEGLVRVVLVVALAPACSNAGEDGSTPREPVAGGKTNEVTPRVPEELAGSRVVFTRADGTFVARADGSALRKVVDLEGVFEFQADVSPDGTRLLLRVDDEGRKQGTWIVGLDGSEPRHVAGLGKPVAGGAADWAPDGRRFVLTGKMAGDRFLGLYAFGRLGSDPRRITPDEWEAQYPAWSPDGRRIAFTHVVPPNSFDIWVVNADGSGLRQLTGEPASDNYPAWSPDGRSIVFSSENRSKRNGLWIMDADGSEQRYLAPGGEPQWEPGAWIVFDCDLQDPEQPGQVCVVRPDGSELARLPLGREAAFPNWLPSESSPYPVAFKRSQRRPCVRRSLRRRGAGRVTAPAPEVTFRTPATGGPA
jgi:dipeptidyl aminopeptidase/acylaminoacyl peptidase